MISVIRAVRYERFSEVTARRTSSPGQLKGTKQTLPSMRQTPLPPKASLSIIATGDDMTAYRCADDFRHLVYSLRMKRSGKSGRDR